MVTNQTISDKNKHESEITNDENYTHPDLTDNEQSGREISSENNQSYKTTGYPSSKEQIIRQHSRKHVRELFSVYG